MNREVAALQSLRALKAKVPDVLDHNTAASNEMDVELYLVMEYIAGPTLKEFVEQRGMLTIDRAAYFALSLCDTLKIAHSEGILHRDIKPDNIIVRDESANELYIVDYGLSFNAQDDDLTQTVETFRNKFLDLPETNTPGGDRRDPRSDVTAVCAVFYFMLTGHHPGHLQDSAGKMPHLRPGFAVRNAIAGDARITQVELILSGGLAPPLQSRFQSVDELSARLAALLQQSGVVSNHDPIATAVELSDRLRQQDRITQIIEFQPVANKLLSDFSNRILAFSGKLGRFNLQMRPGEVTNPALQNLDAITGGYLFTLSVAHHSEIRERVYKVASRGEQCVVIAFNAQPGKTPTQLSPSDWQELAWYEGSAGEVAINLENEFKQWLDRNMQEIATEILGG
jgi:serine/threonine-protein kinase